MFYYKKMFRVFAGIAITYMLLIETLFIGAYWIPSRKDFSENVERTALGLAEHTDARLKSPIEVGLILNASEYTAKYIVNTLSDYERLRYIKFIQGIHGLTVTKKYGIAVTKYEDDYVMMSDGTGSLSFFRSIFQLSEEQLTRIIRFFKENNRELSQFITADLSGSNKLYMIARQEWSGKTSPIYTFSAFRASQLFNLNALTDGAVALLYNNQIVASAGMLEEETLHALKQQSFETSSFIKYDMDSAVPGYRYVYLTKPQQIVTPALVSIILFGLLAMLGSIWIMAIITKRMYSPIQGVLNSTGDSFTSGDEFAHIKSTIQSLYSHVETMSQSLEQFNITAEHKLLHELLTGLIPQDQIEPKLHQFPRLAAEGPYTVILIQYVDTGQYTGEFLHGMTYNAKQRLNAQMEELFSDSEMLRFIDLAFETQAIILHTDSQQQLAEKLRNSIIGIEPESGLEINAAIGSSCDSLASLSVSYRQAVKIANIRDSNNIHIKVVSEADVKISNKSTVYYPLQLEQTLINAVIHGKPAIWQGALEELISTNRHERGSSFAPLALMLEVTVNRIIDGSNLSVTDVFDVRNPDESILRSCQSFEELEQEAQHAFHKLETWFAKEQEKSNSGLAESMLSYIHDHYKKDISLFDLAEHMNLSRNYVSTLFKSAVGRNFKDYVGEYRFKQAQTIIKNNPDLRIREVAELVGCNTEILTRLFTRHGGMLPSDYQQICKNEGISG